MKVRQVRKEAAVNRHSRVTWGSLVRAGWQIVSWNAVIEEGCAVL